MPKKPVKFIGAVIFLLLASCAQSAKIEAIKSGSSEDQTMRRNWLVGSWYGEATTKDGGFRKALMQRRMDGTYTIKFQLFKNNIKTLEQVEAGIWGISGNIYFTATREMLYKSNFEPIDTSDATYYDAYTILALEEDYFKYKSQHSADVFIVKKVPDNFKLN